MTVITGKHYFVEEPAYFDSKRVRKSSGSDSLMTSALRAITSPFTSAYELLGCSEPVRTIPVSDNNPISNVATEMYALYIKNFKNKDYANFALSDEELHSEAVSEVVLPLLFARNYIIRPPHPGDRDKLKEVFKQIGPITIETGDEEAENTIFTEILANFGKHHRDDVTHRIFLVEHVSSHGKNNPLGAIHFSYSKDTPDEICFIPTLSIKKEAQSLGLGSALIAVSYKVALARRCNVLGLICISESVKFYISLGFAPSGIPYEEWSALSFKQKYKIVKVCSELYYEIDFRNELAKKCFENQFGKVLHPDYKNVPKEEIDLENIELPDFVLNWESYASYLASKTSENT